MAQQQRQQVFPHVRYVELFNDGILYECAIMKEDKNSGDLYYMRIDEMDDIDRARLRQIVSRRDAEKYELWDLMEHGKPLPNGVNALTYFHQYVKVRAVSGKIFTPTAGRRGAGIKKADLEKAIAAKAKKAAKDATEE